MQLTAMLNCTTRVYLELSTNFRSLRVTIVSDITSFLAENLIIIRMIKFSSFQISIRIHTKQPLQFADSSNHIPKDFLIRSRKVNEP